ncbi:HPr family phosphocarrier protein [Kaistia algarum]|nr:HPr family phosphocarrier protein [Kaistia algarum]MCX5512084.1 HPr family phosphocarrier protein [Kaistia algarum]
MTDRDMAGGDISGGKAIAGSVLLTHEVGLHARPSVKLTKLAKTFGAAIQLGTSADGPWIDAKSIVKVMAAKAPQGTTLHFRAAGLDADEAVAALVALVERDFDEAGTQAGHG